MTPLFRALYAEDTVNWVALLLIFSVHVICCLWLILHGRHVGPFRARSYSLLHWPTCRYSGHACGKYPGPSQPNSLELELWLLADNNVLTDLFQLYGCSRC